MKKYLIVALAAMAFSACNRNAQNGPSEADLQNDSLRAVVAQKESEINDLVSMLNEVQDGFAAINAAEDRINVARQQGEENNREVLLRNMAEIQRSMQMNRELISTLRQQLKESSIRSNALKANLEQTIENLTNELNNKVTEINTLREELAKKDATIAEQTEEIGHLNDNVRELSEQNTQKEQTVARQDQALHTAYYVFGTKKELKQHNILDGGEVLRSAGFSKDYFTKIDTRTTRVIHLYSKNARLLTSHPGGTYTLTKDAQGQYTLRITDAEKFWSVSKFLVIVVK